MKAVILEIIKEKAVVMKENGTVRRVRNKNYSVGDEIYMKEGIFSHRKWAPIVAALLIFAMVGTGTWAYATPAYEISVDGEDQILFEVNKLGKVINVRYEEEKDGEVLEPKDDFNGKDINEAIILVLDGLGYDDEEYEGLVITAIANDKAKSERIAKSLQERMDEYWAEMEMEEAEHEEEIAKRDRDRVKEEDDDVDEEDRDNSRDRLRVELSEIKGLGPEDLMEAEKLGITPGKYNIVKNLMGMENVERYVNSLRGDLEDEDDDKELSKRIMEEFSARNGEKNNPSVNAPGQEDKVDKEKKEKIKDKEDTSIGETRTRVSGEVEPDNDDLELEEIDDVDSERPENPGKSNEAPGNSNSKNR